MSPSGKQFDVLPDQSLLESGLSAGLALPFGCANGSCGDCRARVLQGQIKKIKQHDYVLTEAQKLAGHCLLCSNTALSNVQIEVQEATSVSDIPLQQLQAKLCRVERIDNVSIVAFKFVRGKALRFLPGQRVQLTLADSETVELPIASCPCNAQFVEFHLAAQPSQNHELNLLAEKLNVLATSRLRVSINGPTGQFTLSNAVRKPKLFIAEGSEFGQLQGLIEQVLNTDLGTPCCLLWKATKQITHYRSNLCRSWCDAIDEFSFVPVMKNADVLAALPKEWVAILKECEVYLGKKDSTLAQRLIGRGIDPTSIIYPGWTGV